MPLVYAISIDNALSYLYRFNIKVGPQNARGIHMRKGVLNKPVEFPVTVQPVFKNDLDCGMLITQPIKP